MARDTNGLIMDDPSKFPSGIKALADYVHADGLNLGVYSDHGTNTCQHKPGSYGYEYLDANPGCRFDLDWMQREHRRRQRGATRKGFNRRHTSSALAACSRMLTQW